LTALDLPVASRSGAFRFAVLDASFAVTGDLEVDASSPPTIANDTDRAIKRTLSGVVLHPSDLDAINPITDRIAVHFLLPGEDPWPCGVFLFGANDSKQTRTRITPTPDLMDQLVILNQPTGSSTTLAPGTAWSTALATLAARFHPDPPLAPSIPTLSGQVGATGMAWPAGKTGLEILTDAANTAGCYSPHYDNEGRLTFAVPVDVDDDTIPELSYDTPGAPSRIVAGSIVRSNSLLELPNRYVAIDTSATDNPIVGYYDVPAAEDYSKENRGYIVATTVEAPGAGTAEQCRLKARQAYLSSRAYEWMGFLSPPDPRHDTWDLVSADGRVWRETGWSMVCKDGPGMQHDLRRTM
jgi:hypothetical protein